jgi:phosphocarrier protein HPr
MIKTQDYTMTEIERRNAPLVFDSPKYLFDVVKEGEHYTAQVEIGIERVSARASAVLVKAASNYDAEVNIIYNGRSASAKSILNVLALGLVLGDKPKITALGSDAEVCVRELSDLIKDRFQMG